MKIEKIVNCFNDKYVLRKKIVPNSTIHAYKDIEYSVFVIEDCKSKHLYTFKNTVKYTNDSDIEKFETEFLHNFIDTLWRLK